MVVHKIVERSIPGLLCNIKGGMTVSNGMVALGFAWQHPGHSAKGHCIWDLNGLVSFPGGGCAITEGVLQSPGSEPEGIS